MSKVIIEIRLYRIPYGHASRAFWYPFSVQIACWLLLITLIHQVVVFAQVTPDAVVVMFTRSWESEGLVAPAPKTMLTVAMEDKFVTEMVPLVEPKFVIPSVIEFIRLAKAAPSDTATADAPCSLPLIQIGVAIPAKIEAIKQAINSSTKLKPAALLLRFLLKNTRGFKARRFNFPPKYAVCGLSA